MVGPDTFVKIPKERVGILIGPEGKTKQYIEDKLDECRVLDIIRDDVSYAIPIEPLNTFDLLAFLVQCPNHTFHCQLVSRGLSNEGMPENSAVAFTIASPSIALQFGWREDGLGLLLKDLGDGSALRFNPRMFLLHFLDELWEVRLKKVNLTTSNKNLRGDLTKKIWKGQRKYPYTTTHPCFVTFDEEHYSLKD